MGVPLALMGVPLALRMGVPLALRLNSEAALSEKVKEILRSLGRVKVQT